MFSLPRKRRVDDDEEDNEGWRVVYAEDIDERRAELLRRLDLKTSCPAKLVNPWANPGTELPRGADPELDEDAEGPSPTGSGGDGDGNVYGTDLRSPGIVQGPVSCMIADQVTNAAPTNAAGEMTNMALGGSLLTLGRAAPGGQEQQRQAQRHQRGGQRSFAPAAAASAVAQMDQLLRDLKRSINDGVGGACSRDGDSDHSVAAGYGMTLVRGATVAAAVAVPGSSGHPGDPALLLTRGVDGIDGDDGGDGAEVEDAVATAASPYAALLGTPGGFGSMGRGPGGCGGPCVAASVGRPLVSPRPRADLSGGHRSRVPTGRGGLGSLMPLSSGSSALRFSSSQKGKKAKFVIREAPNLVPGAGCGGLSHGDLAPVMVAGDGITGNGEEEQGFAPSPTPFTSHRGGSGGMAALLGSGPPPLSSATAAKAPTSSSTPMGRRLHSSAAAPSPLPNTKTPCPAASGGLGGMHARRMSLTTTATAITPPVRQGPLQDTPATTMTAMDHEIGPVGLAVTPGLTAGGGGGAASSVTPLESIPRANTAPASLRELLLPPPPSSRPSINTIRTAGVGVATPVCGPPVQSEQAHIQRPDAAGEILHSLSREQGQLAEPFNQELLPLPSPLSQQKQKQYSVGNRYGQQPQGQRHTLEYQPLSLLQHRQQETPPAPQQQQRKHQERANPLELMGQQSHRQREFVQKLGPPAPPSALSAGRRAGGSGRGTAATAVGLQGRLQAVLANLKVEFERVTGAAATGGPQPPPPAGSLLVEVRRRMREAHLTKATCTVRKLYDANGPGPSANSHVALPAPEASAIPPRPQPQVGEEVHVFIDSKRGDWGIEPGDRFLVLPPYKVLCVRQKGEQQENLDADAWAVETGRRVDDGVCGDEPLHGRGTGMPRGAGERGSASVETAALGGSSRGSGGGLDPEVGDLGGKLVVLANHTRWYDGTVS